MVKVRAEQPQLTDGSVDLERWLAALAERVSVIDLERVRKACELSFSAEQRAIASDSVWAAGRSSFRTGLEMAEILAELHADEASFVAAIIYRAVREKQITLNHVRKQFGDEVAGLVDGVMRMAAISNIQFADSRPVLGDKKDQVEQARRLLVSLVDDVRVALLKLAERTCAIRDAGKSEPAKRERLAREISEIYAPLAHRLGIGYLKWELEDFSFRYLQPGPYKQIANLLDGKRADREEYVDRVIKVLRKRLDEMNIEAAIEGRAKHIFSIWRKMQNKGIPFSQVYDMRAVRILVRDVPACYAVLGVVHTFWRNIPHEFDDYVASPKDNGYRSLHTAVIGPEGKVLEIQIRTREMHEEAEFGICSHWQYKDLPSISGEGAEAFDEKMQWLRQLIEWQEELGDVSDLTRELLRDVNLNRIYLYTPDGHVVDMNPEATPVDFAYRVHTEVGHRCKGAKVNGRVVPLNTPLRSGDQVEIITGEELDPRQEWLYEHLGYITTSRARVKVQSYFSHRARERNIADGKRILLDELAHLGIDAIDLPELLELVGVDDLENLYLGLGCGDIKAVDIAESLTGILESDGEQLSLSFDADAGAALAGALPLVSGLGDAVSEMAVCCQPLPGDQIGGVSDEERQVIVIHRRDCLAALRADLENRLLDVKWRDSIASTVAVDVEVNAFDRQGLLFDITRVLFEEQVNVISIHNLLDKARNRVLLKLTLEVATVQQLLATLDRIDRLANVISARREIKTD